MSVKICAHMHAHKGKTCACTSNYAHSYASCAHVFTRNLYVKNPRLCCGDICKIMLNMHTRGINAHAKFWHMRMHVFALLARVCAQIFTKKILVAHFSFISLSFKFHKDLMFRCGDICKLLWGIFLAATVQYCSLCRKMLSFLSVRSSAMPRTSYLSCGIPFPA